MSSISLPDDELIPDEDLAAQWQTTRRTLARYDNESPGLPFIIVAGKKWRPVKATAAWLANRMRRPNPKRAA